MRQATLSFPVVKKNSKLSVKKAALRQPPPSEDVAAPLPEHGHCVDLDSPYWEMAYDSLCKLGRLGRRNVHTTGLSAPLLILHAFDW